ncbi:endonuclease 8-like 1 [Sphaerodactylus townsendi]|uniref:Endonuclease 8-like 1 n=1 Tax=Sphaerodactylus townsendi TaxID=933632 RepID=A0ACB8E5C1_9SAUR|nr:endonuclease 8-like 1 [Sphaerodactylus townsendi]XP_048337802.1 endonuclease 8-like 1 [Sphaerodactylus townsendi]
MPEGPELFLASRYINDMCRRLIFSGRVEKSQVSKNSEVPFESEEYSIAATSRGKELKLTLAPVKRERGKGKDRSSQGREPMDLIVRFGMSGTFKLTSAAEIPKHAHLRFYTKEDPPRALCFVDVRRFGKWVVDGSWQPDRGPCVMQEYEKFRENVLKNLSNKVFNRPICEALLNQKFFNGVGNYLRAEILHRLKIPPFEKARTVLENLQHQEQKSPMTLSKKLKLKRENPDLLELCHIVPMEVTRLGYDPERSVYPLSFEGWIQCYSMPGMKSLPDANGRTIWFQGDPGPLAPKGGKPRKRVWKVKAEPEVSIPKVRKSGAGKKSKTSAPLENADGTQGEKKRSKLDQENAEDAGETGSRKPNARAQRRSSALQESPKVVSEAESRKRRASARKNTASAAAAPRSRRIKAK